MPVVVPLVGAEAMLGAIILLLLFYGGVPLVHLIARLLSYLPIVGDWIASHLEGLAADWLAGVHDMVTAATAPAITLIRTPARVWNFLVSAAVAAADHAMSSIVWVSTQLIPAWGRAIMSTVAAALAQEHGFANAVLGELRSFERTETGIVAGLQSWITGTVVPSLQHDIASVQTYITGQLLPWVSGLIRDLQTDVIDLNHRADVAAADMGQVIDRLAGLPGLIDSKVGAGVAAAEEAAGAAIGTMAASIAPTLAYTLSEATTFENFYRDCGENLCNNLGPIASKLPGLLEGIEIAALLAFMAAAIADPVPTADDTADVIEPVITAGADIVGAVLAAV